MSTKLSANKTFNKKSFDGESNFVFCLRKLNAFSRHLMASPILMHSDSFKFYCLRTKIESITLMRFMERARCIRGRWDELRGRFFFYLLLLTRLVGLDCEGIGHVVEVFPRLQHLSSRKFLASVQKRKLAQRKTF